MFLDKEKIPSLAAVLAAAICLLLFLPSVRCGFINSDDPLYVLNNPVIRQLDPGSLARMFFQSHVGWWMPLTWLSFAIDYHFWGLNPFGYHLTNILLHAVNTGIVVLIADRLLKGQQSSDEDVDIGKLYPVMLLFAGLFFGVHPLRVESVAWVTERKDVLNGLFALLSILFYLHFAGLKKPGTDGRGAGLFYVLSVFCFACSLMSKSVSVVLPAMLVVLDWIPLGRLQNQTLRQLIIEKWPFWAVSALITIFTFFFAAQSQYLVTYEVFPFSQRVVVSGNAIWEYVRMLFFPFGLNPFVVIPDPIPFSYTVKTLLVATVLGVMLIAGKTPRLNACMLCFLLPLLPVLAFFQNGDQSYADRFTYLPSLFTGIFITLFLRDKLGSADNATLRHLATTAAVCVIFVFMVVTVQMEAVWQSAETYWSRVIRIEPLAITYKERGRYYHGAGRYAEAVADFTSALGMITPTLKPYEYNFYAFRAESFRGAGKLEEAVRDFTIAINLHPHPAYYLHRGLALKSMGRNAEADEDLRRAGNASDQINWFD
jgi:hypothetical protein